MLTSVSVVCSAAMVVVFAGGVSAQGKGSPKPKVAHATPAPAKTASSTPKAHPTAPPKTTTTSGPAKATPKENHKAPTTPTPPTTTTPTTVATGSTLTPVQQKLQRNTNLASKLQSRLPAGTDLNAAAAGFRNLGQFVAAVNVSNNLGLDFPTLKTAMVVDGNSLGQAIQAQKTTVDGNTVATRAERDADVEIRSTEKASKTPKTRSAGGQL